MLAEPNWPNPLAEQLPPLSSHEALVEANRCLNCYDAPCTHACPTHIDVPRFIKKIATGNLLGSARAIFDSNLMGATCSRVCPVQELCEGACVLQAEEKPIMIGRLQRFSMDAIDGRQTQVISVAPPTGKKVAVVGSGPAGLSCAGELARAGHQVTVFEARELPGGLSTYGIIALREPTEVALAEVEMIKRLGVQFEVNARLGQNLSLEDLRSKFDAVFLSVGLGRSPDMSIPGEAAIIDGLLYIERSKLEPLDLKIGNNVVVIGAGNTAIDCATVAKRWGAETVTMVYRRTEAEMTAYEHEYAFVKHEGVEFRFLTQPIRIVLREDKVTGLECVRMELGAPDASGRATPRPVTGSEHFLPADQVVKAIGQEKPSLADLLGLETQGGYIKTNAELETSIAGVFAGGDCIRTIGAASTVMAVQDGKMAAAAIGKRLNSEVTIYG
jgi:dihydropyrimidine dehydrogenase (NAD+) subunit PreT